MYLANDVIQNSKKKGPEYGKEFVKILQKAFQHIGETCQSDDKTIGSLSRILNIWDERGVYDSKIVQDYRNALNRETELSNVSNEQTAVDQQTTGTKEKRKADKISNEEANNPKDAVKRHKNSGATKNVQPQKRERIKSETIEVNGTVETHVILSQHVPSGKHNVKFVRLKKKPFLFYIVF